MRSDCTRSVWRTAGPVEEQHRRQSELTRQVIDDLDRRVPVVVEEAAVGAQHAELQGEAATMVGAAACGDHGQIRRRQAPVPRQFVLARIVRRCSRRRGCVAVAEGSSIDIEMRALQVGREIVTRWSRVDGRRVE